MKGYFAHSGAGVGVAFETNVALGKPGVCADGNFESLHFFSFEGLVIGFVLLSHCKGTKLV